LKICCTFICLFIYGYSQTDTLHTVIRSKSDTTDKMDTFRSFEVAFFENIVRIYNTKFNTNFFIKYYVVDEFSEIRPLIQSRLAEKKFVVGVSGFTIVNHEMFDYSASFFPVKTSLIILKERREALLHKKVLDVGYYTSLYYKEIVKNLHHKFGMQLHRGKTGKSYLKSKELDAYISDSIEAWVDEELDILLDAHEMVDHIGFLYLKNSPLKKMFDPIIKYYTKTKRFYKNLKYYFGDSFPKYYCETLGIPYRSAD